MSTSEPRHPPTRQVAGLTANRDSASTGRGTLTKPAIDAFAATPSACEIASIEDSINRLDFDEAAAKLVARALRRQPLPASIVAGVYPRLGQSSLAVTLIAIAEGDRAATLLELVERDAFPEDRIGAQLAAAAVTAAWRLCDAAQRSRVQRAARLLAVWIAGLPGDCRSATEILARLATETGDSALAGVVGAPVGGMSPELLALEMSLRSAEDPHAVASSFVASIDPERKLFGRVVAPPPLPFKRNQPCPCGSGKKFKRCHGGDEPERPAIAAQRSAASLAPEAVQTMPLPDLGSIVLQRASRLPPLSLLAAGERLLKYRAWRHADIIMEELGARDEFRPEEKDRLRRAFIEKAIMARRLDLARKHVTALRGRDITTAAPAYNAAIALAAQEPDALDRLAAAADLAATDESGELATNLMLLVVSQAPGLGLIMIRGALHHDRPEEVELLLRRAEQGRLALGLSLGDPAWDAYAALRDADRQRREESAAKTQVEWLRESLSDASRRARELGRRVDELQDQLRSRETEIKQAGARAVEPAEASEVRALRTRIDELKTLIRERNVERATLRRQLLESGPYEAERAVMSRQLARGTSSPAPPVLADGSDDDVLVEPAAIEAARRLAIPELARAAHEAIRSAPAHVGAQALRTIGELAAGDAAAWRSVKQAKDMPRPVLMTRIGSDYRLLFRAEGDTLDVLDLVNRRDLLLTLKRLRAVTR